MIPTQRHVATAARLGRPFRVLGALVALLLAGQTCLAGALPNGALFLRDVNFTYPGASSSTTGVGLGVVDYSAFNSAGYVNVEIGGVWAIQNLPVDPTALSLSIPGLSQYLNLPTGPDVAILGDFSTAPQEFFPSGSAAPAVILKAPTVDVNAQGFIATPPVAPFRTAPPGAQPGPIAFNGNMPTNLLGFQPGHLSNIEQDVNQCAPAAVANSLSYLSNRFGFSLSQENVSGVDGDPADSLVGQLDQAMGRSQGQGVGWEPILTGKLNYMEDNDLTDFLVKHQTSDDAPASVRQDVTSAGGELTSTYRGNITAEFILNELRNGEDVEMGLFWEGGGAHFVDLIGGGTIFGVPWVAFQHDANQGYDAMNMQVAMNGGVGLLDGGYGFSFLVDTDGDGRLNFHNFVDGSNAEVVYILSQSVPEPSALALVAIGLTATLVIARRKGFTIA